MTANALLADALTCHDFQQFYAANLRTGLFSGFLTLTAFLFTTKQFVVLNMKQHVYGTEAYAKVIMRLRKKYPSYDYSRVYAELRRATAVLAATLICSLLTSVSQFTLGLVARDFAAAACVSLAAATLTALGFNIWMFNRNLAKLFDIWEEEAEKRIEELEAKALLAERIKLAGSRSQ